MYHKIIKHAFQKGTKLCERFTEHALQNYGESVLSTLRGAWPMNLSYNFCIFLKYRFNYCMVR